MIERLEEALRQSEYFSASEDLARIQIVQEVFAEWFPFENLDVLLKNEERVTAEFVIGKMLDGGRGGLCYEINALLHLFLKELGFQVSLASATVLSDSGWANDRTHVLNLFWVRERLYIVDSGFGSNLPLQPVELDGEAVQSPAGLFRCRTQPTEKGTHTFEMRTRDGWDIKYAFFLEKEEWDDLTRMKRDIHHNSNSPFNQQLLIAQTRKDGTISVNEKRFQRKWVSGKEERIIFSTCDQMLKIIEKHFTQPICKAAVKYVDQQKEKVK